MKESKFLFNLIPIVYAILAYLLLVNRFTWFAGIMMSFSIVFGLLAFSMNVTKTRI